MSTPNASSGELELELTYLAKEIPSEIKGVAPKRLIDIYVPDKAGIHPRLRLRQKGDSFEITKKVPVSDGDASAHNEYTIALDADEFDAISKCSTKKVVKDRYKVQINGHEAEVDVFQEELQGLVVIDFEFSSEQDKNDFQSPGVCLADITQEEFIAGGKLAGKSYMDIEPLLAKFNYIKLG